MINIFSVLFFAFTLYGLTGSEKQFQNSKKVEFTFSSGKSLFVGEDLLYEVKYAFIKIGQIRIKVTEKIESDNSTQYKAVAFMDSYSGLPFVNLHQIYETRMNEKYFSEYFKGIDKKKEYTTFTEYFFDYKRNNVRVFKGKVKPHEVWTDTIGTAEKMFQDGLSILYYARINTGQKKSVDVPCLVNEDKVSTRINFYKEIEPIEIDAVDYEISCVKLDGETDFVSVFGLTGYFQGWFSNDDAAIPIVAKMKVIIGNIKVELKEWKREGWTPPKYKS